MTRKQYQKPLLHITRVQTEQGICYSSDEAANLDKEKKDINVEDYNEIDNTVTFQ